MHNGFVNRKFVKNHQVCTDIISYMKQKCSYLLFKDSLKSMFNTNLCKQIKWDFKSVKINNKIPQKSR